MPHLPPRHAGRAASTGLILGFCLIAAADARGQQQPTIDSLPSETVAYLQRTGDRAGVAEAAQQLDAWVRGQGAAPAGSPTAIFYSDPISTPADMLFWEVRLPVPAGLADPGGGGEVRVLRTEPISRAACVTRHGHPGDDGGELADLREWLRGQGLEVNGPRHETYLTGLSGPGPVAMRVCLPVIKR